MRGPRAGFRFCAANKMFHLPTKTVLDKAFAIGLALKALDAIIELAGGMFLLFAGPQRLQELVGRILASGWGEGANGFFATYLLHWSAHFQGGAVLFAAIYLVVHGVAKLVVVGEVLRGKLWAYPALIILISLFVLYQIYHMIRVGPTLGYLVLTVCDLLIIALTAAEYVRHRARGFA